MLVTAFYQHPQSFTGSISPFTYLIHAVHGTKFKDKFEMHCKKLSKFVACLCIPSLNIKTMQISKKDVFNGCMCV